MKEQLGAKQGIKESIKGLVLESYVEIKVLETAYTLQIIVILYFPFPVWKNYALLSLSFWYLLVSVTVTFTN